MGTGNGIHFLRVFQKEGPQDYQLVSVLQIPLEVFQHRTYQHRRRGLFIKSIGDDLPQTAAVWYTQHIGRKLIDDFLNPSTQMLQQKTAGKRKGMVVRDIHDSGNILRFIGSE